MPPAGEGAGAPPPWHALPLPEVEARLGTGPHGLPAADAASRLARFGPNEIEPAPPTPWYVTLLRQFRSPVIYILLAAALVTLILRDLVDAAVIAAVLLLNASIGFTQERRAERSVRALMSLVAPRARVLREGHEREIEGREVVPGDLVLLESGMRVPADIRLVQVTGLVLDQSLLTGESEGVSRHADPVDEAAPIADRACMAYSGSIVVRGRGRGYAVATGMATELGAIAGSIREQATPQTPLQERMERFARTIGVIVALGALVSFLLGVAVGESPSQMFKVAVALAVAVVPEGLPVVFTVALALGVRRMARRNAIIRKLPAVETLGSTTVIGTDKTGTLTENRMTVRELWTAAGVRPLPPPAPGAEPIGLEPAERLLLIAGVMTNEADAFLAGETYETSGDPTEAALLLAAIAAGMEPAELRAAPVLLDIPFESERQYSASCRDFEGAPTWFVKGAPERLLERSTSMLTPSGPAPLDREAVLAAAHELASRGHRVLAMAFAALDAPPGPDDHPAGLTFLGLQAMMDPPRPGVREAIAGCRDAGIRVVMITGDHAATASAIAAELGIAPPGAPVLPGPEVDRLSDDDLRERLRETAVVARAAPEHKLRVVQALRADGHVVAVTGDGVNDAPALRAADIGVAMGRSGTDVAREAADMVLADDNFVTIYAAVEEGRVTFENVRKVTFFLVSNGAVLLVVILAAVLFQWPLPMVAAQLLWLNLVTSGIQDLALAFEPGEKDVLKFPPRRRSDGIISPLLWERTVVAGIPRLVGTLALFRWELDHGASLESAQTVALTTMVLFQAFHLGNVRSERQSAFTRSPFLNPFLLTGTIAALSLHVAALYLPPTQYVLRVEPLSFEAWWRMIAVASTIILAVEVHKLWVRRFGPLYRLIAPRAPVSSTA
ncbi:HAD-IC family P-type ATPase [Tepidiforma sp.]|uniref:cation-translocating P-type ATPase n=1 Tax=Tepidiforma sp. TaxID=2682230 RepID=UPI0026393965|nr:HAD-IC family P-type ATPase [Tepidiforma sp.]MCX7616688.1 HAD-IC family P-type ATPase [Tepidiforma sp.]